jgi:D-tyrosyl-tRNA(Tyr) deacylase
VAVAGEVVGRCGRGLLILLGVGQSDTEAEVRRLWDKASGLRIFSDDAGHMNRSLLDVEGEVLIVSQFTLYASTVKGNRPSYIKAAKPDVAIPLYEKFISIVEQQLGKKVGRGIFGADMKVSLVNDGPVTIVVDSKLKF